MSLLGKLGFGKSQAEVDAKRRREREDAEEMELRRYAHGLANGHELLAALRLALVGGSQTGSSTSGCSGAIELEELVLDAARAAPSRPLPAKLIRVILSRFNGHLSEPATRLPAAVEALHQSLLVLGSPSRFLELGLGSAARRVLEMCVDEVELRGQRGLISQHGSPQQSTTVSGSFSVSAAHSEASLSGSAQESPLYRVSRNLLRCLTLLADTRAQQSQATGSSESSFSLFRKSNAAEGTSTSQKSRGSAAERMLLDDLLESEAAIAPLVMRLFALQCRCSLPCRSNSDRKSTWEIFAAACRLAIHVVQRSSQHLREIVEGTSVLLVRLHADLQSMGGSPLTDDVCLCKAMLADAGRALAVLSEAILRWPVECGSVVSGVGIFSDHYAAALRSVVVSPILRDGLSATENDAALEAVDHFLRDTFGDRHWRDMADSLHIDTSNIVSQPKMDSSATQWFEGLSSLQHALRVAQDRVRQCAYHREMPPELTDACSDVYTTLEVTALVSSFTSTGGIGCISRTQDAEEIQSSLMHRWLLLHLFSLLPLNPQQVRPAERPRVQAIHRLVKKGGLLEYFFTDPQSGWPAPQRSVQRLGIISFVTRYMTIVDEGAAAGVPAPRSSGASSRLTTASEISSTSTSLTSVQIVLDSLEHFGLLLSSRCRADVVAAVVPLCGLLRWGLVAREQGTVEIIVTCNGSETLASCASSLARTLDATGAGDGTPLSPMGVPRACSALDAVLGTLEFFLERRALLQYQLFRDPATLMHLMLHKSARAQASTLVQMLLCYDAEGESDSAYLQRMSNLVIDLWDIATNSKEIPDDVYLALLECVRSGLDKALEKSPFRQAMLQSALCSTAYAPDCFLRLVHPLNAGWETLEHKTGRTAVMATITSLIRANPALRDRFVATVGGEPFVRSVLMATHSCVTVDVVTELIGLIFEEAWSWNSVGELVPSVNGVSVQNERILEALLQHFLREFQAADPAADVVTLSPRATSSLQRPASAESALEAGGTRSTKATVDALMCLVQRLQAAFKHCRSSVWACAKAHTFEHLVSLLSYLHEPQHVASMEECLSLLTARHIDILQLKRLLGVVSHAGSVAVRRKLVPSVVHILHSACHTHIGSRGEPKNYIALRSRSGATGVSISLPYFPKSGFTISMWVRWEGTADRSDAATLLSLFSESLGTTILQLDVGRDGGILLRSGSTSSTSSSYGASASAGASVMTEQRLEGHQLHPHQWMHLVYSHRTSMFGLGEAFACINGKELTSARAEYPSAVSSGVAVVIGSKMETIRGKVWAASLHGQLNAVYVFSKAFTATEANELFMLGANYAMCFLPSEKSALNQKSWGLFDAGTTDKVLVCVDPRLSEQGKLFNAAVVTKISSKGSTGGSLGVSAFSSSTLLSSAAQVTLHEGAFTCHTSSIIDTTCSLGALQSLILPLLVMQVNASLPIASKTLAVDMSSLLPADGSTTLRDTLKLLDSLIIVDVVRAEALSIGTFPIVAHVLERLGTRVSSEIPQRLGKICWSISDRPELFQVSFQSFFMSLSLFAACAYDTRRAFIDTMRGLCKLPDVRKSMRDLGVHRHLTNLIVKCCTSGSTHDTALREVIFALMDLMMTDPISKSDAESLYTLISCVASLDDVAVAEQVMTRSRSLLLTRPRELCYHLGRLHYSAALIPLLKHDSVVVRCEAVRHLAALVMQSRLTQSLFRSTLASGNRYEDALKANVNDPVPLEEVSFTVAADWLRNIPFTAGVYTSLRCAMTSANVSVDVQSLSVAPPLTEEKIVFPPAIVAVLMLARDAPKDLRIQILDDLDVLIQADPVSWQQLQKLEAWFILVLDAMLADELDGEDRFFRPYRERLTASSDSLSASLASRPTGASVQGDLLLQGSVDLTKAATVPSSSNELSVVEVGIRLLGSVISNAICSPSHDADDLDLLLTYLQQIRHDSNVRLIAHAIHSQVLDECIARSGTSLDAFRGSINVVTLAARGSASPGSPFASPHRQAALMTNPIVERNLQQLFYSVEDQCLFGFDIATGVDAQKVSTDGFVQVAAEDTLEYDEGKSHVYLSPLLNVQSASGIASFHAQASDSLTAHPLAHHSRTPSAQPLSSVSPIEAGWLHADVALKAMQLVSNSVALVNNASVSANFSVESQFRRGGIQRIFLRLLRAAARIMAHDNDYMESMIAAVKSFQTLLDKTTSNFFSGKRSATDVQEDPGMRSSLSIVVTLHRLLLQRRGQRGGAGGRNRFINQRIIERLKAGVRDNLTVLKELGAFQKQSAAHLDSTHRVSLKTLEWLENVACTDVDEFFEIAQREDYQKMLQLLVDIVVVNEDHMTSKVRDIAVRYHSNCVPRSQQLLKQLVMSRQMMLERLDSYASSEEIRSQSAATREAVLGDANAAKVAASVLASNWSRFVARLKGTIWDVDPGESGLKFVKLSRVEQRPLMHLKMVRDKEGTDHRSLSSSRNDDDAAPSIPKSAVRLRRDPSVAESGAAVDDDETAGNPSGDADTVDDGATVGQTESEDQLTNASIGASAANAVKVKAELSHLMHCWSCTLIIANSTMTILLDDESVAYNQPVAKDAQQYLIRPKNVTTWSLSEIVRIFPARRFRMRRVAVEIFFRDRTSVLINLIHPEVMRDVVQQLKRGAVLAHARLSAGVISPEVVYVAHENPRKELVRQRITELWRQREITNMDYLLALNMVAGRTVNDLTQYPIFPWVVADYSSDALDLTSKETFRDLSCPVGLCGGANRREEIEMRYQEMLQMGDVPFHYFTHYSSPAVVLYFMVRVEPFTTCQVLLQGGRFDHADRMFHAVAASWAGVTKNIQDVKEMIPECYYLPEMYLNNNHVKFGTKQDKQEMSHATLPPWANNDPHTLVYRLREALESEYVSANLHNWIDLVFGYKQRGRHAVEALNLFHPHTYEREASSINDVDADEQNIIIDSLDNIGQTPIQLFVKKHPERKPNLAVNPILEPSAFGFRVVSLAPQAFDRVALVRMLPNDRLVVVGAHGGALVYRYSKSTVAVRKEATPSSKYRLDGVMKKLEDFRAALISYDVDVSPEHRLAPLPLGCMPSVCADVAQLVAQQLRSPQHRQNAVEASGASVVQHAPCSWRNTCIVHLDDALFCIHAGLFDNTCVVRALNTPCDELRFSSHRDRVLCIAASEDSQFVVTGGRDTTFIVWQLAYRARLNITLLFSICGHEDEPSVAAISNQLDMVATASNDGQWMVHTLSTGKLEQCLQHPNGYSVDFILLQANCYVPNILIASHADYVVHQYSVNMTLLRSVSLTGRLVQLSPSGDANYVAMLMTPPNVLSSESSAVVFFHSLFLTQASRINPAVSEHKSSLGVLGADSWLTCMDAHATNPQLIAAGTANGDLVLIRTEASVR